MRSAGRAAEAFLGLACAGLLGCNAILGINAPSDELLDAGANGDAQGPMFDDDSGSQGPDPGPGQEGGVSLPDASMLEPSPQAWAAWPMPNAPTTNGVANPQAYSVEVEGVVTDEVTRLAWQQSVSPDTLTWSEAAGYCEHLDLAGGGFRLPARIELLSLLDVTESNPVIDPEAFPDTPAEEFWTASPYVATQARAWVINFQFGTRLAFERPLETKLRVRCVRGPLTD